MGRIGSTYKRIRISIQTPGRARANLFDRPQHAHNRSRRSNACTHGMRPSADCIRGRLPKIFPGRFESAAS